MSSPEQGSPGAEMPTWVSVLLFLMVLAPIVSLYAAAAPSWSETAFFLLFALVYLVVLVVPVLLYDRHSDSSSTVRLSGGVHALLALLAGAVAGLVAHIGVSTFVTLDHALAKSVVGGALFPFLWIALSHLASRAIFGDGRS